MVAFAVRWRRVGDLLFAIGRVVRAAGIGTIAGLVAGFLAGGVGSRAAMKVVALVAGPGAEGRITEDGNRIGAFTTDTMFLLLVGSVLGVAGGLLYMALRSLLPSHMPQRGLAFGVILLAAVGTMTIDARNDDFTRFGNVLVNVGLFAALFLLFGLLVAPLADRADRAALRIAHNVQRRPRAIIVQLALGAVGFGGSALLIAAVGSVLLGQAEDQVSTVLLAALIVGTLSGRAVAVYAPRGRRLALLLPALPVLVGSFFTVRTIMALLFP